VSTDYLTTTDPSDYDLEKPWSCTIGKCELEGVAWHVTRWLQLRGLPWGPVPIADLPTFARSLWNPDGLDTFSVPERWLAWLQRVRTPRPGPPQLVLNSEARYGLQLVYPNGQRLAAAFQFTAVECLAMYNELRAREQLAPVTVDPP
jgi:hypothetical protein